MESEYKRDINHNYVVLKPDSEMKEQEYMIRMLSENHINGLLNCSIKKIDGRNCFYYEVTSKQLLVHNYEKSRMTYEDICRLLCGIRDVFQNIASYLLPAKSILLEPEFIYLDVETKETVLCCLPGYEGDFQEGFRELSEYILKNLDHKDDRAVAAGYEVYRLAAQENYSMEQMIQSIYQADKKKPEDTGQTPHVKSSFAELKEEDDNEGVNGNVEKRNRTQRDSKSDKPANKYFSGMLLILAGILLLLFVLGISWACSLTVMESGGAAFLIVGGYVYGVSSFRNKKKESKKHEKIRENQPFHSEWIDEIVEPDSEEAEGNLFGETEYLDSGNQMVYCLVSKEPLARGNIVLTQDRILVGKVESKVDVVLSLSVISRIHARIIREAGVYYVEDLNSRNGTFLNGVRLEANEKRELKASDELAFASVCYYVKQSLI